MTATAEGRRANGWTNGDDDAGVVVVEGGGEEEMGDELVLKLNA